VEYRRALLPRRLAATVRGESLPALPVSEVAAAEIVEDRLPAPVSYPRAGMGTPGDVVDAELVDDDEDTVEEAMIR
jgi:hypothetical protein